MKNWNNYKIHKDKGLYLRESSWKIEKLQFSTLWQLTFPNNLHQLIIVSIKKTSSILKFLWPALLILVVFTSLSAPLSAKVFAWKDKNGRTIYSDSPPPDNATPAGNDGPSYATPEDNSADDGAKTAEDDKPKDPALEAQKAAIDKNKSFEERQKKQAEEAGKKAQEAQVLAQKQQACNDSRKYLRTLQSRIRVATTDDDGKRSYLNTDETSAEIAKTQESINANCQ